MKSSRKIKSRFVATEYYSPFKYLFFIAHPRSFTHHLKKENRSKTLTDRLMAETIMKLILQLSGGEILPLTLFYLK